MLGGDGVWGCGDFSCAGRRERQMSQLVRDPIWGTPADCLFSEDEAQRRRVRLYDSPRCGGRYSIDNFITETGIKNLDDREKVRLTSWLIEQRRNGIECPIITSDIIEDMKQRSHMSVPDRADMILKYLQSETQELGRHINCSRSPWIEQCVYDNESFNEISFTGEYKAYYKLLAYSESSVFDELKFLLKYLERQDWIQRKTNQSNDQISYLLTVEGYARLAEIQETKIESKQGFVAMWFDPSMEPARENICSAIADAGYESRIIDQKHHINKIDDEIIAEIRRSRFVIVDLTHGEDGARGSVYYEAGFAYGLSIPVIYTSCKNHKKEGKEIEQKVHFDVDHYNRIIWDNPEDLRNKLAQRISAVIGDGPGKSVNQSVKP
ncbi:MAG: hypothetical protein OXF25_10425 [Cyanobacteria bacterium MAG CAR3_bin_5]|nr:hypothetical protein [Cyanobacteria bacterium MAG CAR3_bin_5]